ncbi:hypothetical protein C8J95_11155 [Elizabethkingia sp. YR214]|nr:hypothetical protein C8J95_11155 [Elizabethkingia sp. YR214]
MQVIITPINYLPKHLSFSLYKQIKYDDYIIVAFSFYKHQLYNTKLYKLN